MIIYYKNDPGWGAATRSAIAESIQNALKAPREWTAPTFLRTGRQIARPQVSGLENEVLSLRAEVESLARRFRQSESRSYDPYWIDTQPVSRLLTTRRSATTIIPGSLLMSSADRAWLMLNSGQSHDKVITYLQSHEGLTEQEARSALEEALQLQLFSESEPDDPTESE